MDNSIIESTISKGTRHQDYGHVTKLADKYYAFIVNAPDKDGNQPLNDYLRQFVRREDNDLFEQRKKITKHHTPSICSQIMRLYNKVARSNRVVKLIDHKDADTVMNIEKTLNSFYGEGDNNGVDQFLHERFLPLTFTDPNAWFLISFNPFDENREKPQTFPREYSSKQVIDFEVENDKTVWVIVQLEYDYITKDDKEKKAKRFLMFDETGALEYKQVPKDIKEEFDYTNSWIHPKNKDEKYAIIEYTHNSTRVPLMRVGYRKDIETMSRTFVNPFHYEAMPLLEQFVKVSSELQLSITLHTFPKQLSYVEQCNAKGCNGGTMADGKQCETCKGTGKKVHTTAADIIEIPFPKRGDDMMDISKVSTYVEFPGGVMEFLDNYADKQEKKILRMMFNSESLIQTQFNTATEAEIDVDSVYDTLHPFANKYSEMWMFFVKLTVLYMSYTEVVVYHKFPSDFKLKSLSQLLNELKTANDSDAPSYIRESINNDIADIIYADDQEERSKMMIKNRHFPFAGKTDLEIQNIIMNNLATKFKQVLYANFDSIFDEIEIENEGFYALAFAKQKELVATKVNAIVEEISSEVPVIGLRTA